MYLVVMTYSQKDWQRRLEELHLYLTPRFLAGLALIISSIFAALLIRASGERWTSVWSAAENLAPGAIIRESDISPTKIKFSSNPSTYLAASAPIIGSTVTRPIESGELIPSAALSSDLDTSIRRVALSFSPSSLPFGLRTGELVDLYALPSEDVALRATDRVESTSSMVIGSVGIDGIDSTKGEIGGNVTVTFLVPEQLVYRVLNATINQRLIIIKK
jgi:Chaperone for flagella basal body P-ring formation